MCVCEYYASSLGIEDAAYFLWSYLIVTSFAGKVLVDGRVVSKAGTPVSDKSTVEIKAEIPKYVCRWCFWKNHPFS